MVPEGLEFFLNTTFSLQRSEIVDDFCTCVPPAIQLVPGLRCAATALLEWTGTSARVWKRIINSLEGEKPR